MNLTPTQKADELIEKFRPFADCPDEYDYSIETDSATKCAIVAVEEILEATSERVFYWHLKRSKKTYSPFWQEVKTILTDRL